jgi:hypothetical protein
MEDILVSIFLCMKDTFQLYYPKYVGRDTCDREILPSPWLEEAYDCGKFPKLYNTTRRLKEASQRGGFLQKKNLEEDIDNER